MVNNSVGPIRVVNFNGIRKRWISDKLLRAVSIEYDKASYSAEPKKKILIN
jgi:hypothetical protein